MTVTFRNSGMMSSTTEATFYQTSAKALPGGKLYFFEIQKRVILEYTLNNILSIFGEKKYRSQSKFILVPSFFDMQKCYFPVKALLKGIQKLKTNF